MMKKFGFGKVLRDTDTKTARKLTSREVKEILEEGEDDDESLSED